MSKDFGGTEDGGGSSDYNRPRRPNLETIAYLRGLPLDIDAAKSEISTFLNEGAPSEDFPQGMGAALSAIDEVRMEIASLAGDEYGSQCLEILAHISAPYSETAARVLLAACSGYHLHLATHRYGSHVIQTILQLALSSASDTDLALHEEAPSFSDSIENLPTLLDLILGMVEELSSSAPQLAIHVCGSHVLRTLLCVLGGVNLVSSSRGQNENRVDTGALLRGKKKSKKKKKRKPDSDGSHAAPHAGSMRVVYRMNSRIASDDFMSQLEKLAMSLLGEPSDTPGELQQLACHPSAGPLLIVLLRVLTYSSAAAREIAEKQVINVNDSIADFRLGISRSEPTFEMESVAHEMAKRLLCWDEKSAEQKAAADIVYGLSGEPRGSHLLETLLRLSPNEMHDTIVKVGNFESATSLQDYSEHEVSNFVVQTLLTTIRTKEKAETMLKAMEKVISSGLCTDSSKKRRGILWRSSELAAKYRVCQDTLLKAVRLGFGSATPLSENASSEASEAVEGKKKKQRKKASALEIKDCIPRLIDLKDPEDGGRATLDAAGTRAVYHMLRFSPRLCDGVLQGILDSYNETELELLVKDGLGSRCIMDGILDGPVKTPNFASAIKSLLTNLKGRWVSLSTDRVGQHTVKKLFFALPRIDDKAKLVEELEAGGNRLSGNAMGRSVVEACMLAEYTENRKEWRKTVARTLEKEENFLDTLTSEKGKEVIDTEDKSKSKRKRKRKRPGKDTQEKKEEGTKKGKASSQLGTDSIIRAMTVPTAT